MTVNLWREAGGSVVRALGLHMVASGSVPVLTSALDLFPVVPDSTLPRFLNSQLRFLIIVLFSLNCRFFQIIGSGVPR